jgi:predicted aspartyl protease
MSKIISWQDKIKEQIALYEGQFVVHDATDILFVHQDMLTAENWIHQNKVNFNDTLGLFLVPNHFGSVRLRMLKIKSLAAGEWTPTYPVKFVLDDGSKTELDMIVDSGADITFIPKTIGERLGLTRTKHETTFTAYGVGSEVSYLVREMPILIDGKTLTIRLLWGQDAGVTDVLLGRLDVFDNFDVLFSQRRQTIQFISNEAI